MILTGKERQLSPFAFVREDGQIDEESPLGMDRDRGGRILVPGSDDIRLPRTLVIDSRGTLGPRGVDRGDSL